MAQVFLKHKAQISTEFLIILATVIIISLVAVSLIIFFGQTQTESSRQEIRSYWAVNAYPIKIMDMQGYVYPVNNRRGEIALLLENSGDRQINITQISLDGDTIYNIYPAHSASGTYGAAFPAPLNIELNPGETRPIFIRPGSACLGSTTNKPVAFSRNITFTYKTRQLVGITFKGVKPIVGNCNPV